MGLVLPSRESIFFTYKDNYGNRKWTKVYFLVQAENVKQVTAGISAATLRPNLPQTVVARCVLLFSIFFSDELIVNTPTTLAQKYWVTFFLA